MPAHRKTQSPAASAVDTEPLLTRQAAAAALSARGFTISKYRLDALASAGSGPPFMKFGRASLYRPADLFRWAMNRPTPPRSTPLQQANAQQHAA